MTHDGTDPSLIAALQNTEAQRSGVLSRIAGRFRFGGEVPELDVPYPEVDDVARRAMSIGYSEQAVDKAMNIAAQTFPNETLTVLSDEGSSAVVLSDGKGKAYKVMRNNCRYSYIEDEARAISEMAKENFAPQFDALYDVARKDRYEVKGMAPKSDFKDASLRRIPSESPLAIIVMEELQTASISSTLSDEELVSEFDRVLDIANRHSLIFGDTELQVDLKDRAVKLLDAGGLGKERESLAMRQDAEEGLADLSIGKRIDFLSREFVSSTFLSQSLFEGGAAGAAAFLNENGTQGLHDFLIAERKRLNS